MFTNIPVHLDRTSHCNNKIIEADIKNTPGIRCSKFVFVFDSECYPQDIGLGLSFL